MFSSLTILRQLIGVEDQGDRLVSRFRHSPLVTRRVFCYESSRLKSLTEYLSFEVPGRRGFINITPKIEELVSQSGVREGLCLVNAMHITASVFINDDEPAFITTMTWAGKTSAARPDERVSTQPDR
jgi:hypothetical protein